MDLSKKIKEIRKFSQFGLVTLSPHALKRAKERGIEINDIYSMLCSSSSTICQFHHKYKITLGQLMLSGPNYIKSIIILLLVKKKAFLERPSS